MQRQTILTLAAIGIGIVGLLTLVGRPARLIRAHVVRVEAESMPHAEIALAYSRGFRPASVIIDIQSPDAAGSATADGDDELVFVPLTAPLASDYTLTTKTMTRLLGRLWIEERRFTA